MNLRKFVLTNLALALTALPLAGGLTAAVAAPAPAAEARAEVASLRFGPYYLRSTAEAVADYLEDRGYYTEVIYNVDFDYFYVLAW